MISKVTLAISPVKHNRLLVEFPVCRALGVLRYATTDGESIDITIVENMSVLI